MDEKDKEITNKIDERDISMGTVGKDIEKELDLLTEEDARLRRNKELMESAPKGNWSDLVDDCSEVKDVPIKWRGRIHIVQYRVMGWEDQNKVIAAVSKTLGRKATGTEYERSKQKAMLKKMVTTIDGRSITGNDWYTIPYDFGELMRIAFFNDTGELTSHLRERGLSDDLIDAIMEKAQIQKEDGVLVDEEESLKNLMKE